jgi:CHAT domain-containing protein
MIACLIQARQVATWLVVIGALGAGAFNPFNPAMADTRREPASYADSVLAPYAIDLAPALEHLAANRYVESESAARAALAAVEEAAGRGSLAAAVVLDALVAARNGGTKAGDPQTLKLARRAVAIKEKALGPDHPQTAASLAILSTTLREQTKYTEARELLERAFAIQERTLGPDHPEVGKTLNSLGILSGFTGDYAGALELYARALAVKERAPHPDSVSIRHTLNSMASVEILVSDLTAAEAHLNRALAMGGERNDLPAGMTHQMLGALKRALGDYAGGQSSCERSVAILEQAVGPDHPQVARGLDCIGIAKMIMGDYAGARAAHERGLAIRERTSGPDHPDVARFLRRLATVSHATGDLAEARDYLERALAIEEKTLGPEHPQVASGLTELGGVLEELQEPAAARPLLERALAIREKVFGPDNPSVTWCLSGLARVAALEGKDAEAETLLARALAIREKANGPDHAYTGMGLLSLADQKLRMGQAAEARPLIERTVDIFTRSLGEDHPYRANALTSLARAQADMGELALALDTSLEAEAIGRSHVKLVAQTLAEREALRDAEKWRSGLDLTLAIAARADAAGGLDAAAIERVWNALIGSRGLVLDEMAARRRSLRAAGDSEVQALADEVAAARGRLARLTVRGPQEKDSAAYRDELAAARADKEEAERRLAARSAAFRRDEARSQGKLPEIASRLPEGSALVAFARQGADRPPLTESLDEPAYLAFVLTASEDKPHLLSLGAAREVESLVAQWEDEAIEGARIPGRSPAAAEQAYRRAATALKERIWDPIARHLGGASRVFVVPAGSLHMVNLAAIPGPDDRYLVETGPLFHRLTAERDLLPAASDEMVGKGLLALGGIDFDAAPAAAVAGAMATLDSPPAIESGPLLAAAQPFRGERPRCEEFLKVRFAPLPRSAPEAHEVAELWQAEDRDAPGDIMALVGADASEAAFKVEAPGHRALHLATHGFFLGGRCGPAFAGSRGIGGLSPAAKAPQSQKTTPAGENPLLLSGLALAGANRRDDVGPDDEDGILTAEEIAALDLTGVEWVVLSGCETGRGEIGQGEGVFGLQRAFRIAGARTVVMSLWAVKDEAAAAWMRALYSSRSDRRDTAAAVREASLKVLGTRRDAGSSTHPFFWGAFVAAGDWR